MGWFVVKKGMRFFMVKMTWGDLRSNRHEDVRGVNSRELFVIKMGIWLFTVRIA